MRKYLSAAQEDFLEDFPRLPPEANPLDPRFADPRMLARHMIPQNQRGRLADPLEGLGLGAEGEAAHGFMDPNGRVNEEALFAEMVRLQEMGIDVNMQDLLAQMQHMGGFGEAALDRGNVDLDAPLMQLFLQTLLPWSRLGRR